MSLSPPLLDRSTWFIWTDCGPPGACGVNPNKLVAHLDFQGSLWLRVLTVWSCTDAVRDLEVLNVTAFLQVKVQTGTRQPPWLILKSLRRKQSWGLLTEFIPVELLQCFLTSVMILELLEDVVIFPADVSSIAVSIKVCIAKSLHLGPESPNKVCLMLFPGEIKKK